MIDVVPHHRVEVEQLGRGALREYLDRDERVVGKRAPSGFAHCAAHRGHYGWEPCGAVLLA